MTCHTNSMNKELTTLLRGFEEDTVELFQLIDTIETVEDFARCAEVMDPLSNDWVLFCNELSDFYFEYFVEYA